MVEVVGGVEDGLTRRSTMSRPGREEEFYDTKGTRTV